MAWESFDENGTNFLGAGRGFGSSFCCSENSGFRFGESTA